MKNNTLLFSLTVCFCLSLQAASFNEWWHKTKTFVKKYPATILAAVSVPLAITCFYYGIKAKNEREELEMLIPGFDRFKASLERRCTRMNRGYGPRYRVNWGRVYDTIVRRESPALADKLLSAHLRKGLIVPAIMASFFAVSYGSMAYTDELKNSNQEEDKIYEIS